MKSHSTPTHARSFFPWRKLAGVTLTELLVVLVIISTLATIAVPVYVTHAEKARVNTAQFEVKQLAEAEEAVFAIHGFYVPLQLLDDLPGGSSNGLNADSDAIENESTQINLIDPTVGIQELASIAQPNLSQTDTNVRVKNLVERWEGPFLNTQRVYIGDASSNDPLLINGVFNRLDWPLDPWGSPYRFYSPLGVIGSGGDSSNEANWSNQQFGNGVLTSSDDRFDRFTIVSYGPNGISDNGTVQSKDDIFYFFGKVYLTRDETSFAPIPNNP